ncbi:MAG: efflux RND transporter periplasmic adaptor subunit [Hyphomicrobiales bacterium]|nr:efflux RND transporter periplasmic adaptor subunit [Hyphomicrobiales bacterium]
MATRNEIRPVELLRPNEPEPVREPERKTEPESPPAGAGRAGRRMLGLGALIILLGAVGYGGWRHYQLHTEVIATAEQARDSVPSVLTAPVRASALTRSVIWPASTQAFAAAEIYARATGYIDKRNVDIGDRVKQADLLAELAVPELDDQISQNEATLNQLRAALEQAQANLKLAQVTWDRDRPLVGEGWATQQQGTVDVQTLKADDAAVSVARANVEAQEKQLATLRQNRDYALVRAPFNGVVTQRNVDVGSLVQGNANTGTFMFEVMQRDVIRVFVYVPQDEAFGVAPGVEAIVRVPEIPTRGFPGKVTRIADALQSGTRTLLTEIDIPNPDDALPPGVYCTVELKIPRETPSLIVPAGAIVFNSDGLNVWVVEDGVARVRHVTVARDFGTTVEVSAGVKDTDQVILNPPVDLTEGHKVKIRQAPPGQMS